MDKQVYDHEINIMVNRKETLMKNAHFGLF